MMQPLRAFLFSFAVGIAGLLGAQLLFVQLTYVPPEPPLQGPLNIPVA